MPLLTAVLTSWTFIIVFARMPKRLNLVECIFVFFISIIVMTSTFTLMDIDLHRMVTDKRPEYALAIIVVRTVLIPTVIMMSVNGLQTQLSWVAKSVVVSLPIVVMLGIHWAFQAMGVVTLQNWSTWYSVALFLLLTGVIYGFSWGFAKLRLAG